MQLEAMRKTAAGVCALMLLTAIAPEVEAASKDERALAQMQVQAARGDPIAQYNLGAYWSQEVEPGRRNYPLAAAWYRKAAQQGSAGAAYNLGLLIKDNLAGQEIDRNERRPLFEFAAKSGNASAMYELAMSIDARTEPAPYQFWLRRAGEKGERRAMDRLGTDIQRGRAGFKQDLAEGAAWYRKSAEAGFPMGMNNWGVVLDEGVGVPVDAKAAALWMRRAAEKGECVAVVNLSGMYGSGKGVEKSEATQVSLLKNAMSLGSKPAAEKLARLYRTGQAGVGRDLEKARQLDAFVGKPC